MATFKRPLGEQWQAAGICVFLLAITWLVFGQTLHFPFINFDDDLYVYENRPVLSGLSLHGIAWAFCHVVDANWHPLTMMSHMLDCTVFGLNAGGHHFTNVLLHSAAVVSLFLVLRSLTGAPWRSGFVAGLFAIHPLHVESVAWIAERKDVLSALFFILTIGAYARYTRQPSITRYLLVALLFGLGLMCKPMLVTLPLVLLLLDYWPLGRLDKPAELSSKPRDAAGRSKATALWKLLLEKIPLLGLSALSCAATLIAQEKAIAANSLPISARLANAVVALTVYVRQMVAPINLALLYPHPGALSVWPVLFCLACTLAISLAVWMWRRQYPYLVTGWLWYAIMLIPVIGIVQVGLQSHADRYTYLPHVGLYVLLTWLVADLSKSWPRRSFVAGAGALAVLFALSRLAYVQTSYWSDSQKLWEHTLAITANNDLAHDALAACYLKEGRLDDAIMHLQIELQIRPGSKEGHSRLGVAYFRKGRLDPALAEFEKVARLDAKFPSLHYNLATVLLEKGNLDDAIAEYQKELATPAAETDHDMSNRDGGQGQRDEALLHGNYGTALSRKGRLDEALDQFRQALAINPSYRKIHYNIGTMAMQKGDFDGAIAEFQKELEIQPDYAPAHADLGVVLSQKMQVRDAIAEWRKALALDGNNLNAMCNLSWVLATHQETSIRDGTQAVELAQRAVQLSGGTNPRILRILAAANAEAGHFDQAIDVAQKATQLALKQNNQTLANTLDQNIASFRANTPLRD